MVTLVKNTIVFICLANKAVLLLKKTCKPKKVFENMWLSCQKLQKVI